MAVEEINGDVGHDALFHVSTIHSFLWSVIKPFQTDLLDWVKQRLNQKIEASQLKIDKPGTRQATKEKEHDNIARYQHQLVQVGNVRHFTYGTGSDYENGILGHSDILKIGPALITEHELMRTVTAQRFPVIFVDESQDTDPSFVNALKILAENAPQEFCLGFFGDPVQKIYMTGIGDIAIENNWGVFKKPENFRCPTNVLNVINRIRAEADGLVQTHGRMQDHNGTPTPVQGTARLFILPADDRRADHLATVRAWLMEQNEDPLWQSDEPEGDVRMLVIVHRIAASRLGFPNLYSSLNDKAPENLKSGLIDGTAWVVRPFIQYLLPLIQAHRAGENFKVMTLLKQHCPRIQPDRLEKVDAGGELETLKNNLDDLNDLLAEDSTAHIGDIIKNVVDYKLVELDERFQPFLQQYLVGLPVEEETLENSPLRFLYCLTNELWGYQIYIEEQSPFSTQQGIKGAEFDRVLVVVDEEENTAPSFSYGKYFGEVPLSTTDQSNIDAGKDNVLARTLRLFYVCCSRAVQDLAVVIFSADIEATHTALNAKGLFDAKDIHRLDL